MGPANPVVSNSIPTSSTMEAPPPLPPSSIAPPLSSTLQPPLIAPPPQPTHLIYSDSVDSSPRSRNTDSWDDLVPPTTATTKLRFMCSYGGHIVPRPHDKSLCYLGGVTRIIVIDRHGSLLDLSSRLSKTLLNGKSFTLKYQLPSEDLDSLISVTTDEDLDNMIEEFDRMNSGNTSIKPSRIRLFLFTAKPDSSQSIGPILDSSAKSEDWFWNTLNSTGVLARGLSDSASGNCLLGLDDEIVCNNLYSASRDTEAGLAGSFVNVKNVKQGQDVHSVPDSPMLDTTSSFGSTSSSPSLANLPPIRVHVDNGNGNGGVRLPDQKMVGIEEQLVGMSVGSGDGGGGGLKKDDGFAALSSPSSVAVTGLSSVPVNVVVVGSEYQNRVFSDDERSDQGVPVGYNRKPLQPQPQPQLQLLPQQQPPQPQSQSQLQPPQSQGLPLQSQQNSTGLIESPSPNSISSGNSFANAVSRLNPVIYQDPIQVQSGSARVPSNPVDLKLNASDPSARVQMQQQVQDPGYLFQQQQYEQYQLEVKQQQPQQPQLLRDTHYIQHLPSGSVPMQAYYTMYPSQQQTHPHHLPQADQQYGGFFYMPARQAQAYNFPVQQSKIGESGSPFHPGQQNSPNPGAVPHPSAFNQLRSVPISNQEVAAGGTYRTTAAGTPQMVQVPSSQHQHQYIGYSQIHPSQSMTANSVANANYSYEIADPVNSKLYYTQAMPPTMPQ